MPHTDQLTYKKLLEKIAVKFRFEVELKQTSFKDIETGKINRGFIIVDRHEPDKFFYHILVNGRIFDYTEDGMGMLILKLKKNDSISLLRHRGDLDFIPEFGAKNYHDTVSGKEYFAIEDHCKPLKDIATRVLTRLGLSASNIVKIYDMNALNLSLQDKDESIQGQDADLNHLVDISSEKSLVVSVNRDILDLNKAA